MSQPIDIEQLRQMRDAEHCFLAAFEGRISSKLTVKLMEDLPSLLDELADLRAYKERTEAGLQLRCEALLELLKDGDVLVRRYAKTEIDWLKQDGLWRDPPQAEVQP